MATTTTTTTPPPPAPWQAVTPPTPLHGVRSEPCSPRRSSRISAMQDIQAAKSGLAGLTAGKNNADGSRRISLHSSGASHSLKSAIRRTSSQVYSPPESPEQISKSRHESSQSTGARASFGMAPEIVRSKSENNVDSIVEDEASEPVHKMRRLSKQVGIAANSLPTPSKTPRKHNPLSQPRLKATARVLFSNPVYDVPENTMPAQAGRKTRKSRVNDLSTALDGCEEDVGGTANGIEIYTDSKERVPDSETDMTDENPFVVKKGKRNRKAKSMGAEDANANRRRHKRNKFGKHGMGEAIDKAVANNEGMVYVFRGKKVFRRFAEAQDADTSNTPIADSVIDPAYEAEITRRIGDAGQRALPRSRIQPRRLFAEEIDAAAEDEEALTENNEEADTEIEDRHVEHNTETKATPRKAKAWRPATPPTTGKRERKAYRTILDAPIASPNQHDLDLDKETVEDPLYFQSSQRNRKSPFDSWDRTKTSSAEADKGVKRISEQAEQSKSKRLRSADNAVFAPSK